jgi:hypothetical protein
LTIETLKYCLQLKAWLTAVFPVFACSLQPEALFLVQITPENAIHPFVNAAVLHKIKKYAE